MAEKKRKFRHTGFTTSPSHLQRLKNGEDEAWREFYRKYRSMILAISRKFHLPEKESEDLLQEVAAVCSQKLQTFVYEPEHCRFRSFLFTITANLSRNLRWKTRRTVPAGINLNTDIVPGLDEEFMREYENFVMERCFQLLKQSVDSETYLAFELIFIENRPIPEVASITGKTANALYSVKHRCLKKLQAIFTQLQTDLETPRETDLQSAPSKVSH